MFGKLFGGIAKTLGLKLAVSWIKAAANGEKGPVPHDVYWALAGVKTWTGLGLIAVGIASSVFTSDTSAAQISAWVAGIGLFGVSVGLLDKGWRSEIPSALANSTLYRLAVQYAPATTALLTTMFGAVEAMITSGNCTLVSYWPHWSCETYRNIIVLVGLLTAQLGLSNLAWTNKGPEGTK